MIRHCIRCRNEIVECMGFVLARDIVAAQDGKIPWKAVREQCGFCVERKDAMDFVKMLKLPGER